jgi:acyl-CoA thioesterase FadM
MNLWFRLFCMLISLPFRRKASVSDVTSISMTVLPTDLDFNMHVNNGRYLTMADVGRIDHILRTGTARAAFKLRAKPIVGDAIAKFRRDLKPFQRFVIETRACGWDEKWTYVEHRFVRHGRVLGVVAIRGLFLAPDGAIAPARLAEHLENGAPSSEVPAWIAAWSASCDLLSEQLRAEEKRERETSGPR